MAGGWTIDQRQQDPLVLSNKFQMLQNLDEQEHDQATPNVSFGYVSSPIGIKNTKCVRNSPCDNRAKVDDIQELTLAQQEKLPLVGNKNKTGTLVVGAKKIIRPNAQAWSVAHNNTHTSNWDSRLTGNYSPNSMGQGDLSCEFSCPTHAISYSICQHNQECIKQTGGVFGFVPQNNLQLYDGGLVQWDTIPDIIASHYIVKSTGLPNFLKSRIPVSTNLNITKWRSYLKHYWDQQLPDLLEYGFPLDFDRNCQLQRVDSNHKSADIHLNHVKAYVQEQLSHKAIIGPFEELPGSFHISPLMTRDKQDSDKKRTIMDLSWPKGHSVNNGVSKEKYLGTQYTLHYPSVDNITAALRRIGPGAKLFKVDISRAFRHLRVDPADIDLLGLQVQGRHFIDVSTPFGYRNGSLFFQRCSDAIRYIMAEHGFPDLFNYIDDLIYVGLPSKIDAAFDFLMSLLADLGLEVSSKKLVAPATSVICLGILIDSTSRTISIPSEKLGQIVELCHLWSQKTYCSKRDLQSLLGHLLYIAKCVRPARIFLNRMLQVLRDNADKAKILLTEQFARDLNWFNLFLSQYNGVTFYDNLICQAEMHLDASLTGLGAVFNDMIYNLPIEKGYMGYNTVQLEILNILVACTVWATHWANKRIKIWCDNLAVVEVLNSGKSRDDTLATCARNIWMLSAMYNFDILVYHISGKNNIIADLLSRWTNSYQDNEKLHQLLPNATWINTNINLTFLNYII